MNRLRILYKEWARAASVVALAAATGPCMAIHRYKYSYKFTATNVAAACALLY